MLVPYFSLSFIVHLILKYPKIALILILLLSILFYFLLPALSTELL